MKTKKMQNYFIIIVVVCVCVFFPCGVFADTTVNAGEVMQTSQTIPLSVKSNQALPVFKLSDKKNNVLNSHVEASEEGSYLISLENTFYTASDKYFIYDIHVNRLNVGDVVTIEYFRPVLDPETYLPTNEKEQWSVKDEYECIGEYTYEIRHYIDGTLTSVSQYTFDDLDHAIAWGFTVRKAISKMDEYPGGWEMRSAINGGVQNVHPFTLIDDLPPEIAYMGIADGCVLKGNVSFSLYCKDTCKTDFFEIYITNCTTGVMSQLTRVENPNEYETVTFGTETLGDGDFILRFVAEDVFGNHAEESIGIRVANISSPDKEIKAEDMTAVGEPINVANGNVFFSEEDIRILAKEVPLLLKRYYSSQDDFDGSFGYGWRSNYDITLTEQADGSLLEVSEDGVHTIYQPNGDGTYIPSAGKYSDLVKHSDGTFLLTQHHGRKLSFNRDGQLTTIEERNGTVVEIMRLVNGVISEVTDTAGRKLVFASNDQGNITRVTDPAGREFKYEYDDVRNLIAMIDPLRNEEIYEYDNNHNMTLKRKPNGALWEFAYDISDRAIYSTQNDTINRVDLEYDFIGRTTTVTDSLGNVTQYAFNNYGLVTKITDPQGNVEYTTWDDDLNKTSVTDKNGNTTVFAYDTRGNLIAVLDPLGALRTFTYEPTFDFVATQTDPLSQTTQYEYDAQGNLLAVTDALGNVTQYTYDSQGQMIQAQDVKGNSTQYDYNAYGNVIAVTDALGNQKNFTYDILGNVITARDEKGNETTFTYDSLGRLTTTVYPDSSKTVSDYDAVGNLISFTDQMRRKTEYTYDCNSRLISTKDALKGMTTNAYDTEGNCTSVTDAAGHVTQYVYDSLGRLIETIDPLGHSSYITYDPNGNVVARTDANNDTTRYSYDGNNRLIETTYPDSTQVIYVYDALGQRTALVDASGATQYAYDAVGRVTEVDGPGADDLIRYNYDGVGNRVSMALPDSSHILYAYDSLNRPVHIIDIEGQTTTYAYDAVGNLIEATYPNGVQAVSEYDALNRLISLSNVKNTDIISSFAFEYNDAGMRTRVDVADGGYILYTYDKCDRLTKEQRRTNRKKVMYAIEYSYDAVGNRLTEDIDIVDSSFQLADFPESAKLIYRYNEANQLTHCAVNRANKRKLTLLRDVQYNYDANGNLTQERAGSDVRYYTYDYENRLVSVSNPAGGAAYSYDGDGKRMFQEENGLVKHFLYDGMSVVVERDNTNQDVAFYTRGLQYPGGIGGLISSYTGAGDAHYYFSDGLGNVERLTDEGGYTEETYSYDAFGNVLKSRGSEVNRYQFQTKEVSPASGLVFFGARYYNPVLGRWISKDPSGMIDGPNLYAYVGNNPVNFVDPWGLYTEVGRRALPPSKEKFGPLHHSFIRVVNETTGEKVTYSYGPVDKRAPVGPGQVMGETNYTDISWERVSGVSDDIVMRNAEASKSNPPNYDFVPFIDLLSGFVGVLENRNCQQWTEYIINKSRLDTAYRKKEC